MHCLTFTMPRNVRLQDIHAAKLWLYKTNTLGLRKEGVYKRSVYEVKERGSSKYRLFGKSNSPPVKRSSNTWIQVDITSKIKSWLSIPGKHVRRLDVTCPTCWRRRNQSLFRRRSDRYRPIIDTRNHNIPLIVIDIVKRKNSRKKRNSCSNGGCCLKDFYLDFKDIGWSDWIIYPTRVNIKQCQGTCTS